MITTILTAGAVLGVLVLTGLGITLARGAALADRRTPLPPMPEGIARQHRLLADRWHREGRLTPAGYAHLLALVAAGRDAYVYWSGGERVGSAVVWDGAHRIPVEEWNDVAEHLADALDGATVERGTVAERGKGGAA